MLVRLALLASLALFAPVALAHAQCDPTDPTCADSTDVSNNEVEATEVDASPGGDRARP